MNVHATGDPGSAAHELLRKFRAHRAGCEFVGYFAKVLDPAGLSVRTGSGCVRISSVLIPAPTKKS